MAGILEKVFKEPPAEEKAAHKIKHAADDAADAISNLRTELTGEKKVFNEITPEEKAAYTVKIYADRAADAIGDAREKLGFDNDTSLLRSAEEKFDNAGKQRRSQTSGVRCTKLSRDRKISIHTLKHRPGNFPTHGKISCNQPQISPSPGTVKVPSPIVNAIIN
jgi:hypothetical protein